MALRSGTLKALLIGIAVLIVGIFVERSWTQHRIAAAVSSVAAANARAAALQSRVDLLTANVWVYKASTALDNRNFGEANEAMAIAVTRLNSLDAGAANLDNTALAAVRSDASALKIAVTTHLEPQRTQLLKLAASLTELAGASAGNPATAQ